MTQIIDLGKLRFYWAGEYNSGTVYELNDVVKYGGNVYVYTYTLAEAAHTPTDTNYWALMISGLKFEGAYANGTTYQVGDGVAYGGKVYIAIADTTGNTPPNNTYWSQFADGIQYEGTYSGSTAYQPNDVVKYGAKAFIAKSATTGNVPTNATYWDMLVDGISAEGVYNAGTAYTPGDLVAYGANIYICTAASTGNLPTNATYFSLFINSVQSAGTWSGSTTYYLGDLVNYGGNVYVALRETINDTPDTSASDWQTFLEGVDARGTWATSTTYYINDVVTRGGSTYRCLLRHASGTFATDLAANKWVKYNSGIRWRGEWASSTAYLVDDLVYNGVSTYIATADFTSDATDFENDTDWDLLSLGADTLPNQVGNDGKFLSTNGTSAVWADSGTLESLTVNDGIEVLGDILSRGSISITSRAVNVVNKILTNNVATLTTDEPHYFDTSDVAVVSGVVDFNGTYTITGTPSNTTFTFAKTAANVGSTVVTGGTAAVTGNISTAGTLAATGAATLSSTLGVTGDTTVGGDLYVGSGAQTFENTAALTNTIAVGAGNANAFVQYSITNLNTGAEASTDFIAYADNGDNDSGWIDMGITSSTFDAANFGITGKNDGYIFMSAPAPTAANVSNKVLTNNVVTLTTSTAHGFSTSDSVTITGVDATFNGVYTITGVTTNTFTYAKTNANVVSAAVSPVGVATRYTGEGNLVLATDANGSANKIIFAAGGLESANEQMSITPDANVHIEIDTASTNATTGALTVVGGIGSNGDVSINGTFRSEDPIFIGTGAEAFESSGTLTSAMMVVNNSDNSASSSYSQIAFRNADATSSTDMIVYMDNGNDTNGWMGMGIAGSNFDDTTYGITAPGDGYIFHNAINATYTGNMVFATGAEGSENKLVFAAGGFDSGLTQMEITPGVNVHIEIDTPSTSPTTGALTVVGGVGISGDLNIQGNVDIEGTIVFGGAGTTVETSNLSVSDPFIFVGAGNPADILDLGFLAERSITVSAITETVTNKALTNNVATITTTGSHTYRVGDTVVVASVDATFDGTYAITGVTSNTFTYAKTAANVASQADTGTTSVEKRRVYDGIARDATDNVVKFFQNLVVKPTSTVNFAEAGVTYADIKVDDIDADAITGTGNLTIATDKLIVNAASGAVTMANTLDVTGISTLNGGINSSGTVNFTGGLVLSGTTDVQELRETVANPSISSNAATLVWTSGNIFYTDASAAGANITYNVTGVPTDVNKIMTINIFQVQGSTGRIPGAFQIDGSAQTIKWVGGSAPTPTSSAGKIDVFSFTMHRLSGGTWNVYGSSSLNF
jgi:hypothetical protein